MNSKFTLAILILAAMLTFSGTCFPPLTPPPGERPPTRDPGNQPPTATATQPGLPPRPTSSGGETGMIAGNLSYPSEWIPALRVVAFNAATMAAEEILDTQENDSFYTMTLPVGTYYVVAYTMDGALAAGYTQSVLCGLTVACTDHSLVAVQVLANMSVPDIDPGDWYAPPGTFPPMP